MQDDTRPASIPMTTGSSGPLDASLPGGTDRIELLQTFIRIVEGGSLSAAAAQLGTTQPTVSRRLQALERSLGVKLLQRSTHTMKLNSDGERCFAHAKELVDAWQSMQADLRGAQDSAQGTLRVVAPHAFGQEQLIAPLTDYLLQHPGVSVEWLLHDRRPDFVSQGVDCAIQVGSLDDPSVVAIHLAEVPRIVVAAPSLMARARLQPDAEAPALSQLPWLALSTFYRDEVVLKALGPGEPPHAPKPAGQDSVARFSIRPRLSTDSLYALRNAALSGLGAAIVSAWLVQDDIAAGRLLRVAPAWEASPLPVYLVYPYARFYPARLRFFLQIMRERMPALVGMRSVGTGPATLAP